MNGPVLGSELIVQVGILCRNIEETAAKWAEFLGVEKPGIQMSGAYEDALTQYEGQSTEARCRMAFFHSGQLDIELIEPDANPSTWRDCLERNGEGLHHIAFFVKDMKGNIKKLEDMGIPLVQKGEYHGGRYAYMDATQSLKTILELLEND